VADGTVLAAAGLKRLGIESWPGVVFSPIGLDVMVPAVGQAAVAVQCRAADAARFVPVLDAATARAVNVERAFQAALGGGCHTAFAAHVDGGALHIFHEKCGVRKTALADADFASPAAAAERWLKEWGLLS